MIANGLFRSKWFVAGVLAAFSLLVLPVAEYAQVRAQPSTAAAGSGGSLVGFIYGTDMKTPVSNAVVRLRDVSNSKEYQSTTTDANGMYKIANIAEGRYILGVTSPKGEFNFDYLILLKGNEMAKLSVALSPGGTTSGQDAAKKSFFTSPAGIVLMVVAVGVILYAIFAKSSEASPIR